MNQELPIDISVITPVYNDQSHIRETMVSVANTMRGVNYEHIVIDDGSCDSTFEMICDLLDDKTKYFYQDNQGQPEAVNAGLSQAQGRYAMVVNSDDPLIGGRLGQKSIQILDSDPSIVATYPDWQIIDASGRIRKTKHLRDFSYWELIGNFNCLIGPGGVFRVEAAKSIGGWSPSYRFVPDYDFWLRLSTKGEFVRIPEVLAQWRTHSRSISVSSRGLEMAVERIRVIEEHLNRVVSDKELAASARSSSYYSAATLSIFDSNVDGRNLLWQALAFDWRILLRRSPLRSIGIVIPGVTRCLYRLFFARRVEVKGG